MIARAITFLANGDTPSPLSAPVQATATGDLVVTSGVPGIDFATGRIPDAPQEQFERAFTNLARLLESADVPRDRVCLLNVHVPDRSSRAHIDHAWLALFPGEQRPARKTNEAPLPAGMAVVLQAVALKSTPVASLEVPGLRHRSPLPMGARVGSLVFSSVMDGSDPKTGEVIADAREQARQAFRNVETLMRQAGGDARGVNHIWAFVGGQADAAHMLAAYLEMFPNDNDRPARKTVVYPLPAGLNLQLQISGDVGGRSGNYEVEGVTHHDPIPLASRAGHLLQSSGIHGIDPATSRMSERGALHEAALSLASVEALMINAGGALENIAGLTILVRDLALIPAVRALVEQRFGARTTPSLHFVNYDLPPGMNVQFHVTGWL
jgi:2-iminobutanoate/2-iminopropanoate deaminase